MLVFIDAESTNCILNYQNMDDNSTEMAELSFEGLDGASCNLSVTTNGSVNQCLEAIEIVNNGKQTYNATTHIQ